MRQAVVVAPLAPRRLGATLSLMNAAQSVLVNREEESVPVRVLIVDDQEPFRMAARMVVEATDGFDVVGEVETGEAAVEAAHTLDPDLVLMDVNLPGINGLEATRQILDGSDRVVILLLSTYEEEEYGPRAAECGAAAYVPKSSFGPDRLAQAWAEATAS